MEQQHFFFSIIIPAHNEELYIDNTLKYIRNLDYPQEKYEVFVIENGSNDKTYVKAKLFEGRNINVISSSQKGVSLARNLGIKKIGQNSDWTIFLDADTILKNQFLRDLNVYLQNNPNKKYVIGTTSIKPTPETKTAKFWFAFYDICHKIFKVSYAIQIVKSSLLSDIKFDEKMATGEDLKFIKDAREYGNFFFFSTKDVYTSTRRFEQVGWIKIFFLWTFVANLPTSLQKRFGYNVVR